jgi:hypothetical protein
VNLSTDYEIELEVDRSLPLDQLNCLLGIQHFDQKACANLPSPIMLNWVVLSGGNTIRKGASEDIRAGSWGPTVARTIGRMAFEKDRDYFMDVMSLRDVSMLAAATPRISIVVNPSENETYAFASGLLLILSILFGAVGCSMARGYSSKDLNSEKRVVQRNSFADFGTNVTMNSVEGQLRYK